MLKKLLRKELLLWEGRASFLLALTFFSLLLSVVAAFSLQRIGISQRERLILAPGVITIAILFIASGLFNQISLVERTNEALHGLFLQGYSGMSLFLSKFLASTALLCFLTLIFLLGFGLLFEPALLSIGVAAVIFPTLLGLSALGTLLSMIAVTSSGREILFPVIYFPLVIPLLGGEVLLLREILDGGEPGGFPLKLVWGLGVLYTALGALLFEETM